MLLLALDTSSPLAGVCLLEDGRIRTELTVRSSNPQESDHVGNLQVVLARGRVAIDDVDAFACTIGPGGFTGLRVGLSLMKGLTADGSKPLFGISTLAALARGVPGPLPLVPCLDARRGEVYAAVFREGVPVVAEGAYDPDAFSRLVGEEIDGPSLWLGEGSRVYRSSFEGRERFFGGAEFEQPRAASIAALAWEAWERGERPSSVGLVPNYLRAPAAELNAGSRKNV